jgi:hypothetical protein
MLLVLVVLRVPLPELHFLPDDMLVEEELGAEERSIGRGSRRGSLDTTSTLSGMSSMDSSTDGVDLEVSWGGRVRGGRA